MEWAWQIAEAELGQPLPRRWSHSQGVARAAVSLAKVVNDDADLLSSAAVLHDVGYAPRLASTGFHPLDGARFLRDVHHADERLAGSQPLVRVAGSRRTRVAAGLGGGVPAPGGSAAGGCVGVVRHDHNPRRRAHHRRGPGRGDRRPLRRGQPRGPIHPPGVTGDLRGGIPRGGSAGGSAQVGVVDGCPTDNYGVGNFDRPGAQSHVGPETGRPEINEFVPDVGECTAQRRACGSGRSGCTPKGGRVSRNQDRLEGRRWGAQANRCGRRDHMSWFRAMRRETTPQGSFSTRPIASPWRWRCRRWARKCPPASSRASCSPTWSGCRTWPW
jgi:hypothetical protein